MYGSRLKRSRRRERRAAARILQRPKLSEQLLQVWEHLRWVFANFCEFFDFIRRDWKGKGPDKREESAREKLKKLLGD